MAHDADKGGAVAHMNGRSILAEKLLRAQRKRKISALLLVAPLFFFLLVFFVYPVFTVLTSAIEDTAVRSTLPRTVDALVQWDGPMLPGENVYRNLVVDLVEADEQHTLARAANRLNEDVSGMRSLVMRTARYLNTIAGPPYKERIIEIDAKWGGLQPWQTIKSASGPVTLKYLLAALDLERGSNGAIQRVPESRATYLQYLTRTLTISFGVVVICFVIGYPLAFTIANASPRIRRVLLLLVLLPFWTSLLVRTTAWMIILRTDGLVNGYLLSMQLVQKPLELIFNRTAVYIVLVHIMLPFFVLPVYSVMIGIPGELMRAAASLGARPMTMFATVYFPLTLPGVGAGCLLVFVITLGFYITPALVGGARDQMLSFLIAESVTRLGNWSMASAAAVLLLLTVAVIVPFLLRFSRLGRSIAKSA